MEKQFVGKTIKRNTTGYIKVGSIATLIIMFITVLGSYLAASPYGDEVNLTSTPFVAIFVMFAGMLVTMVFAISGGSTFFGVVLEDDTIKITRRVAQRVDVAVLPLENIVKMAVVRQKNYQGREYDHTCTLSVTVKDMPQGWYFGLYFKFPHIRIGNLTNGLELQRIVNEYISNTKNNVTKTEMLKGVKTIKEETPKSFNNKDEFAIDQSEYELDEFFNNKDRY